MSKHTFLAFDLGATSGRAVLGILDDDKFEIQEIHRFPNAITELHGKCYWDVLRLYDEFKQALIICARKGIKPTSIGIDTWGVDYGYIAKDGTLLGLPRAYRDTYTDGIPERYFQKVPRKELYEKTGIQFMNFNSLFQLYAAKCEDSVALKNAKNILFMPDLFSYFLTGKMVCEYTEASTSQIVNPAKRDFERELLRAIDIDDSILLPLTLPGTIIGELTDHLAESTGIGKIKVCTVAGHDTASAIAAIPTIDRNFAYLSSGTWSLMGIECEQPIIDDESYELNFTNEGGIDGTTCFLKNITGMWLLEECRKEWEKAGKSYTYEQIVKMANETEQLRSLINPEDECFTNPSSMTAAIADYCRKSNQPAPTSDAEYIRCIFDSLALCYRHTLIAISRVSPHPIERLHIIGGGSKNALLNQLTANATGIPVYAGPSEATAIGNCMIQAMAAGLVADRHEMRKLISKILPAKVFTPQDTDKWECAYNRFKEIIKR